MSVKRISQSALSINTNRAISISPIISMALSDRLFLGRSNRWNNATQNASTLQPPVGLSNSGLPAAPASGTQNGSQLVWVPELKQVFRVGGVTAVCQMWSPSTNTWTTKATPPLANMTDGQHGGYDPITKKIYVWGMQTTVGPVLFNYAYDPFANTWSAALSTGTTNTHILQYASQTSYYNGKFYTFGGQNSSGAVLDTMSIYDPSANTWSTGTAGSTVNGGPGVRLGPAAGLITAGLRKNMIAVASGSNTGDDRVFLYSPTSNSWTNPGAYTVQPDANNNVYTPSTNFPCTYAVGGAFGRYMYFAGGDKSGSNRTVLRVLYDTHTAKIYPYYMGISSYVGNAIFLGGCFMSIGDGGFWADCLPPAVTLNIIMDEIDNSSGAFGVG